MINVRGTLSDMRAVVREVRLRHAEDAHHTPRPPASGLVADVGGGDRPHPRADVVVEKYVADSFERELGVSDAHPLVVADGEALPFAEHAFDYVVASHVLEHAIDPQRFAGELARVGKAGFVQVPSREAELTFGWDFHPWLVDLDGDTLVFEPRGDAVAPVGRLFHDSFRESILLRLWWGAHRSVWHHSVHWTGAPSVRVLGTSAPLASATFDLGQTVARLHELAGSLPPLPGPVAAALRCPVCGGGLGLGAGEAACRDCHARYPVIGNAPVLLAEARL